jgi:hypothetical protein
MGKKIIITNQRFPLKLSLIFQNDFQKWENHWINRIFINRGPSNQANCLLNAPKKTFLSDSMFNTILPGRLYSADDQCKLIMGPQSTFSDCSVK